MGDNAQGKTNILEAIYLMSTLRSFRGIGGAQMTRHGSRGYFVGGLVQSVTRNEIRYYWSARSKRLTLNQQPVRKLADFLGTLRCVAFCSEDIQLVKGAGGFRRRFVDLLLTQTYPHYLSILQRYARILRSRNAILKRPTPDIANLDAFSRELVKLGNQIIQYRKELIPKLSPLARLAHRRISEDVEELKIEYLPSVKTDFEVELHNVRPREIARRVTLIGPHRDDVSLRINDQSAAQYGSEGQKRTLAVALKIAQAEYLTGIHGSPPVLLIDDVMGELDIRRRSGLMPLLARSHRAGGQVFMTCTERSWPEELAQDSTIWEVNGGAVSARETDPQG